MKKTTLRLNHFLSSSGVCARRKANDLIKKNKVTVNNKRVKNPAFPVQPAVDTVKLEGKLIKLPKIKWYIAFNKPRKVLTSMNDPKGRPCISDYFKRKKDRIFPVGRLDWHSEGLILLTNDGDFAMKVMSPKQKIPKTYLVKLNGMVSSTQLAKLKKGVSTEIGRLKALYAEPLRKKNQKNWVKVILNEGRNRQLHRMFEKIGFQIKILRRTGIGKLKLRSLKPGEGFVLTSEDMKKIFSLPPEIKKTRPSYTLR